MTKDMSNKRLIINAFLNLEILVEWYESYCLLTSFSASSNSMSLHCINLIKFIILKLYFRFISIIWNLLMYKQNLFSPFKVLPHITKKNDTMVLFPSFIAAQVYTFTFSPPFIHLSVIIYFCCATHQLTFLSLREFFLRVLYF